MRRATIGMGAVLLLLAAACGGGSDNGGTTSTTTRAETTTTVDVVAGQLDVLEGDLNGCGVPDRELNPDGSCPS